MPGIMDTLGVSKEQRDGVKAPSTTEGYLVDSALYPAEVKNAYIRKTDAGAQMLEVELDVGQEELLKWGTCVKSGDDKGNKTTWTVLESHPEFTKKTYGVGSEVNLPGIDSLELFLDAVKLPNAVGTVGKTKYRDVEIDANVLTTIIGKKLMVGVTQEEKIYNGNLNTKNDIKWWLTSAGIDKDGNNAAEAVTKKIAKNPVKKVKGYAATPGTTPNEATAANAAGW